MWASSGPRDSEAITAWTVPLGPPVTAATVSCDHLFLFSVVISTIILLSCSSETDALPAPTHWVVTGSDALLSPVDGSLELLPPEARFAVSPNIAWCCASATVSALLLLLRRASLFIASSTALSADGAVNAAS